MIKVKLGIVLKSYCSNNDGHLQVQFEEDLTVEKMLKDLKLNSGLVWLVLVNGKVGQKDCRLSKGDEVELYPIFGGG